MRRVLVSGAMFMVMLLAGVAWADTAAPAAPVVQSGFAAFWVDIAPALTDLVKAALVGLCGVAAVALRSYQGNNSLAKAGTVAGEYILNATKHLLEGLAPDIKAALANDGKIDQAERAALIQKGMTLLKAELPAWVQSVLGGNFGAGLDTMLAGKVANALDGHLRLMGAAVDDAPPAPVPMPAPTRP